MRLLRALALAACLFGGPLRAAAEQAPARVVSMNLCSDQLAMLLADAGQLISVSRLAQDPDASSMARTAAAYHGNHGRAEEIFLLEPDLVIAGTFTDRATVEMLRRLDIPVATLSPAYHLDEVPERLREMGRLLGREEKARALISDFEAELAALRSGDGPRPRGALYSARGYSSGPESLSGGIMAAAGLHNIAGDLGLTTGGRIALEQLVMAEPDILILSDRYPGTSQAEEILDHPALSRLRMQSGVAPMSDRDWVCGTPFVLRAIDGLARTRREWEERR